VRLAEARTERMVFEGQMDVDSPDDALMLAALSQTEAALAHEIGFLLLRERYQATERGGTGSGLASENCEGANQGAPRNDCDPAAS